MIIRTMTIGRIEHQGDRVLLYQSETPPNDPIGEFHVITSGDCQLQPGDVVQYEPFGMNFGFLVT